MAVTAGATAGDTETEETVTASPKFAQVEPWVKALTVAFAGEKCPPVAATWTVIGTLHCVFIAGLREEKVNGLAPLTRKPLAIFGSVAEQEAPRVAHTAYMPMVAFDGIAMVTVAFCCTESKAVTFAVGTVPGWPEKKTEIDPGAAGFQEVLRRERVTAVKVAPSVPAPGEMLEMEGTGPRVKRNVFDTEAPPLAEKETAVLGSATVVVSDCGMVKTTRRLAPVAGVTVVAANTTGAPLPAGGVTVTAGFARVAAVSAPVSVTDSCTVCPA